MGITLKCLKSREEWLEKRRNYIGGSDAACVVGTNPWKTNVELWQEKTGRTVPEDISDKPCVKYGTQAEEHLRELFKLDFPQYEVSHMENNIWFNSKYPFAHASLDGTLLDEATGKRGILEIKTTEILNRTQREKWKNGIPQNYYCQVLHYLAVTDYDFAILKAQLKTVFDGVPTLQTKHYFIEREEVQEDIDYLMQEEEVFWQYVECGECPPLRLPNI